jgi:hypothetical protein
VKPSVYLWYSLIFAPLTRTMAAAKQYLFRGKPFRQLSDMIPELDFLYTDFEKNYKVVSKFVKIFMIAYK